MARNLILILSLRNLVGSYLTIMEAVEKSDKKEIAEISNLRKGEKSSFFVQFFDRRAYYIICLLKREESLVQYR